MSTIAVDRNTFLIMWDRTYAECLHRCLGDKADAHKLCAYYMRDWEILQTSAMRKAYAQTGQDPS